MARTGRVRCETDLYHVTILGSGRQIIFEVSVDRNFFLNRLGCLSAQERVDVSAYCLMDNRVHIVLFDPEGDLGVFMQRLCCVYARYFIERHDRSGHLFQGRYSSAAVEDVRYLLTVVRYVHDNPVKAGVSGRECYQWSSYRGYVENKGFVSRGLVYELIGGAARFYVHDNPVKAGVSGRECYQWSSYRGYVENKGFVSRGLVYELIGGAARFVEFSSSEDSWRDLARVMHSDGVGVLEVARTALGGRDPLVIGASPSV